MAKMSQSKVNEPFKSNVKSSPANPNLKFEFAVEKHIQSISDLMILRNPKMKPSDLIAKVEKEVRVLLCLLLRIFTVNRLVTYQ